MTISNEEIYTVLLDIKQDIGVLTAQTASQATALANHVRETNVLGDRVRAVETNAATDEGATRTWRRITAAASGVAGGVVGALASRFLQGHH